MDAVADSDRDRFFAAVDEAAKRAVWCAVATCGPQGPRVRMVHPTWEGDVLWFATFASSPKIAQLRHDPRVDVQFQVAPPDFVHLMVRGRAEIVEALAEKRRVWDVIDYDLSGFWPDGPEDPGFVPVRIRPTRVELSKSFGMADKQVWRA